MCKPVDDHAHTSATVRTSSAVEWKNKVTEVERRFQRQLQQVQWAYEVREKELSQLKQLISELEDPAPRDLAGDADETDASCIVG
mmetsp:Transcript_5295/g.11773  ORF Transcript_5295/g.11773 Transcript_5295/m.11773 type:complete len:85 (-) Transcript_5295:120-374(-)